MQSEAQRMGLRHWLALSAIVIVAAGLRIHHLKTIPLSNDELGTMEVAAGRGVMHLVLPRNVLYTPPPPDAVLKNAEPFWHIPSGMRDDVHPPLYFVLLRFWQDVFGGGDAQSRLLSVVAGLAGIVLIFDVGRWLAGTETGLWAALLMALAQPQIVYSQTARPYALATALILAAADAMLRIVCLGSSRRRIAALIAAATAAALTLYFAVLALAALGLYALIQLRGRQRRIVVLSFVAAGVMFLGLWGHGLATQHANFSDPHAFWYKDHAPDHVTAVLERFGELPVRFMGEPVDNDQTHLEASAAVVLYFLPWLLVRRRREFMLLMFWLIACTAIVAGLDLLQGDNHLFWIKYTLLGAPAVYLLVPMLGSSLPFGRLVPIAAAFYCAISVAQAETFITIDYVRLATDLDRLVRPNDGPIIFDAGGRDVPFTGELYMGAERYAENLHTVVLLHTPPPPSLMDQIARRSAATRHCLLVTWLDGLPNTGLPGWHAVNVIRYQSQVCVYEMAPP
jgi:hypothetical protein